MSHETPLDLDAIEARAGAATEGPWEIIGGNEWLTGVEVGIGSPCGIQIADAEFIAAARTDVPALVAEAIRLREMHSEALDIGMRAVISRNDARVERNAAIARAEAAEAKVAAVGEALRAFDGQHSGQRLGKTLAGTLWASVHTALTGAGE